MKHAYLLLIVLPLLLIGCMAPQLEREDVPVHWGIRLDNADHPQIFSENFAYTGPSTPLLVEIPVSADSNGLPIISHAGLTSLAGKAQQANAPLTIALTTTFSKELFPKGEVQDKKAWFEAYRQEIADIVDIFGPGPPNRLILGNDWKAVEQEEEQWISLLQSLRSQHPGISFGYGTLAEENVPTWVNHCDFLAIEYPALADPNPKRRAMELNPMIAAKAQESELPLLIYRANLMGPFKAIALKNQLRFWPEEMDLTGIFINSLYPRIAPLDTTSYFGLHTSPDLLDFLKEYREE